MISNDWRRGFLLGVLISKGIVLEAKFGNDIAFIYMETQCKKLKLKMPTAEEINTIQSILDLKGEILKQ